MTPRKYLAPLFLLASADGAYGADAPDTDEIIVSATRTPRQGSEIGSSVTVITAQEITERQYSFTADALRDTAGVTIARNGSYGGFASARIRGAGSGQTLVVIDGIVVNDPAAPAGGFNFANLDVADIENIEILRGPQSILYGADAIGGVISITTKAGGAPSTAFLEGGSRGTLRGGATLAQSGARAFGRLTVSGARADGVSRAAVGTEADGFRSIAASFSGGLDLTEHWQTQLFTRFGDVHTEIDGFPPPFFSLADTAETEDTQDYAAAGRLSHRHEGLTGALTVSYNAIERVNRDSGMQTFSADGDRISADYLGELNLSDAISLVAGGEYERTSVIVSGIDEAAHNGAVFALLEAKPMPNLTISFGGRHDEFSNFDGATTARAAAVWEFADAAFIRASWGQGFRAPTLFELNFDQFGTIPNPDLRPERAGGFDVGVEKKFINRSGASDVTLKATFFHQRVKDQIDFDFAGSGFFNIDQTRSRGVEFEGGWRANNWFSASFSYSYIDAIDRGISEQLLRQPKHSGTAVITVSPVEKLSLSTSIIANGRENDFPAPNDGFVRIDVRASYEASDRLEIYGRLENAADADYQDVSGFGEPGISVFGGVRVYL